MAVGYDLRVIPERGRKGEEGAFALVEAQLEQLEDPQGCGLGNCREQDRSTVCWNRLPAAVPRSVGRRKFHHGGKTKRGDFGGWGTLGSRHRQSPGLSPDQI